MFTRWRSAVLESSTSPRTKLGSTSADLANAMADRVRASLPEHGLEAGDEGDLRVADAVLGQAHAVPGVGPVGLQVDRPLEFGRGVVVVRLPAELAEAEREEAELEVDERVAAVGLGQRRSCRCSSASSPTESDGRRQRVAEALQLGALVGGLRRADAGHGDGDQRDRQTARDASRGQPSARSSCGRSGRAAARRSDRRRRTDSL